MPKHILSILTLLLIFHMRLSGQCPDRPFLRQRILIMKASDTPVDVQLHILMPYVRQLEVCPQTQDSCFAFLLQRIGALYYFKSDFSNAVNYTRRGLRMLREQCAEKPSTDAYSIRWYNFLRLFYDSLHLKKLELEAIDSNVFIALRTGAVDYDVLRNHWTRTNYYLDVGDYERCIDNAELGETLTRRFTTGKDSVSLSIGFSDLSNDAMLATERYEELETRIKKDILAWTAAGNQQAIGTLLNQLSFLYIAKKDSRQALDALHRSYECHQRNQYHLGCSQSLNNMGVIYYQQLHDYPTALAYFRKALAQLPERRAPNSLEALEALTDYDGMVWVYLAKKNPDSALFFVRKGLDELGTDIQENDYAAKRVQYLSQLLIHKGDALFLKYQLTHDTSFLSEAHAVYKTTDLFFEKVRNEQIDLLSQLNFRRNIRELYEHALGSAMARQDTMMAFYFFERSRAILLADQLDEQASLSNFELRERSTVRRNIQGLEKQMRSLSPASQEYEKIQRTLYAATQASDRLDVRLRRRRRASSIDQAGNAGMQALRQYLAKNGQSFLEIYAGDSTVYSMLISGDRVLLHSFSRKEYDSLSTVFIGYISDAERLNRNMPAFIATANKLFRLLFPDGGPVEKRMLISPDGRYFPYEALVADTRGPSYLLNDHPVCYTYSARYLLNGEDKEPVGGNDLMGIAPVRYASYLNLSELPGSNGSLDQITEYYSRSEKLVDANASKNYFLRHFSDYRLIQLYTHAVGAAGREPKIYFADSALSLSELIPYSKPQTRLIVLSACETANGQFYQGEGVFSFNREFAALGIPAAIVNCWSVDNQATYRLTEKFYKYLSDGDPTDIALNKAKLEFLHEASGSQKLPYYWAAPVLTGRNFILTPRGPRYSWALDLLLVAGILLLIFFAGSIGRMRKLRHD